jgi:hypothetical protein
MEDVTLIDLKDRLEKDMARTIKLEQSMDQLLGMNGV